MGDLKHRADRVEDAYQFGCVHRPSVHRSYLLRFYHLEVVVECYDGGS
jgi:hypothetical protein